MGAKLVFIIAGLILLTVILLASAYIVQENLMEKTPINETIFQLPPQKHQLQSPKNNFMSGKNETATEITESSREKNESVLPAKLNMTEGVNESVKWYPDSISLNYKWVEEGLEVFLKIKLPDPCHKVRIVEARVDGRKIIIYVEAESPPPNTYCIQVLPRPYTAKLLFNVSKGYYKIEVVVNDRTMREVVVKG